MNKISTYLSSLIISVLLVFSIIGSSCAILACINITDKNIVNLFDSKHLEDDISSELEKHYSDQFNASGIPASVFMDGLDKNYIRSCSHLCIEKAFDVLENGGEYEVILPESSALSDSVEKFFNEYADENNIEKDENFDKKIQSTKDNTYSTVKSCSDVFKFGTINSKGILNKSSKFYSNRIIFTAAASAVCLLLIIILLIINRKKKSNVFYWSGISAVISGIAVGAVSIYLIANRYFDSFSIKQPAVFKAYTGMMYKFTESFMAVGIAATVVGICLIVIYALFSGKKKSDVKPTTFNE